MTAANIGGDGLTDVVANVVDTAAGANELEVNDGWIVSIKHDVVCAVVAMTHRCGSHEIVEHPGNLLGPDATNFSDTFWDEMTRVLFNVWPSAGPQHWKDGVVGGVGERLESCLVVCKFWAAPPHCVEVGECLQKNL